MRKEKQFHFIYKTTNILSGRYYIGMHSTDNLEDGYLGSGIYLKRSLNKHGRENHKLEILEYCKSRNDLRSRENQIINLNEIAKKDCMNLRVGGSGPNNLYWEIKIRKPHSEETKRKMRNSHLGKKMSAQACKKMSENAKNRTFSKQTRNQMSKSQTGRTHTDISKQKISDSNSGENNGMYGKIASVATKRKMSEAQKKRWNKIKE